MKITDIRIDVINYELPALDSALLPTHANAWFKFIATAFESTEATTLRERLLNECASRGEFTKISIDGDNYSISESA